MVVFGRNRCESSCSLRHGCGRRPRRRPDEPFLNFRAHGDKPRRDADHSESGERSSDALVVEHGTWHNDVVTTKEPLWSRNLSYRGLFASVQCYSVPRNYPVDYGGDRALIQ